MPELEVWLIGTPDQLDAAVAALTATGRHVLPADPDDHPKRIALSGEDRGRHRLYLRIAVAAPRATVTRHLTTAASGQDVISLDAYRRTA
ncbi:hypothetical protein ABT297_10980 [Dactylosporangium sp. NPDC000555]|uniref:hypothetical protein n=1 Tax=Dactylosporangium sp. NPDC000555 TaxID=3154260 RepID=UPI003329146A